MKTTLFAALLVFVLAQTTVGTNRVTARSGDLPALDLSTPEKAFCCAVRAFEAGDVAQLQMCLSKRLVLELNQEYVKGWQMCLQMCTTANGGTQRKIVGVTSLPDQRSGPAPVRRVHIKLAHVEGFQDFFLMVFEDGQWKFDER